MPEIIEVERLTGQLKPAFKGRQVVYVEDLMEGALDHFSKGDVSGGELRNALYQHRITHMTRLAKMLCFHLDDGRVWMVHLNSTGWWLPLNTLAIEAQGISAEVFKIFIKSALTAGPHRFLRVLFRLDDGQLWGYTDPRTLGSFRLVPAAKWGREQKRFGPDWLYDQAGAKQTLIEGAHLKGPAKMVLQNQKWICGLGSYMSCEALHLAGIHPSTDWGLLTKDERVRLANTVVDFLTTYLPSDDYTHWKVFDKRGQTCTTCNSDQIDYEHDPQGRGSHFCPTCQPLRRA